MGNCNGSASQPEVGTTLFVETYLPPPNANQYDIETGGFTDIWDAINDWSNKNTQGKETFKRLIHTYMQHNVCSEPHVVIHYGTRTWIFNTRYYSEGTHKYRIIKL